MPRVLVSSAAHVLSDYLLTSEGNHCYQLFKHLADYDYQFEALSPYVRVRKSLDNVVFHQVGSFKMSPTSGIMQRYALHSEFLFRSLIKARKLVDEMKPDIIHHMLPAVFNYTFSPLALVNGLKQPFILGPISIRHYNIPLTERILLPLTSRLHKETIKKCARIITITDQTKNLYIKTFDERNISTIPFGVDTDVFKPARLEERSEECEILYTGSLYPLKGVHDLIRAIANVRKHGLKANLTIVGEGQQKEALTALTRALGIEEHVKFEGFVPYSNMPSYYKRSDIFCFPTLGEPFGKAVIEAMACGKPVIATNVGGPAEIIQDEVDGLLVPPSNPEAIALQITRLIEDKNERRRLGERARETAVNRFSWSTIAEKYHQLYSGLL
ncbi:glycosyltransferase family 4 protein [Candidatus Bathyarchaeota archaeon]|nr:glycosyltransferase family 4 protein [Candidatus Bathyarchaeota archaeon]